MRKKYLTVLLILLVASTIKAQLAGGLLINSYPDSVTIKINNVVKGKTPLRVILNPGSYTLIAEKPLTKFTRLYYESKITVTNGKIDNLYIGLEELEKGFTPEFEAKLKVIISKIEYSSFIDNRDGKTYKTVKIGTQIWMAENLAYKTSSGSWAYKNDESYVEKYGRLYNWETARTVCPDGWYLPSDEEWNKLTDTFGGEEFAGKYLKSITDWKLDAGKNFGNNKSGFNALPGSIRGILFSYIGEDGGWWSCSPLDMSQAYSLHLFYANGGVKYYYDNITYGMSVRCLKEKKIDVQTGSFKDSRDDKIYKTIKIGTQTWMAENLAYKTSSGCWAYNNDQSNVTKYGYLYNWETAKKVCPSGWHLPSDAEWTKLEDEIGGKCIAGKKLRSAIGWKLYKGKNFGDNESGFGALPGGYRLNDNGSFYAIGKSGYWWSSTPNGSKTAWGRYLSYYGGEVYRSDDYRANGNSVRCIKD